MLIIFTFSSSVYQHMCRAAAPLLRLTDDQRWEWLQLSGRSFLTGCASYHELDTKGKETKQETKSLLQSQNLQLLSSLSSILESVNPTLQTCESVCEEKCI